MNITLKITMTYYVVITSQSGYYIEHSLADAEKISAAFPGSHIRIFRSYDDVVKHLSLTRTCSPSLDKRRKCGLKGFRLVTISRTTIELIDEDDTCVVFSMPASGSNIVSEVDRIAKCLSLCDGRLYIITSYTDLVEIYKSQDSYNLHRTLSDLFHELSQRKCVLSSIHPLYITS